jgi:hypothetical protein
MYVSATSMGRRTASSSATSRLQDTLHEAKREYGPLFGNGRIRMRIDAFMERISDHVLSNNEGSSQHSEMQPCIHSK